MSEYILTSDGELYHHGVKGMKWGIRRYQNEDGSLTEAGRKRLSRFTDREIDAVKKRREYERKHETYVERSGRRYKERLERYGEDDKRTKRASDRYIRNKTEALAREKIAQAEIDKLKNYKLSDIKSENAHIGKKCTEAALKSLGATVILQTAGVPIIMYPIIRPDHIKTGYRVNSETQEQIRSKARSEAVNSLYDRKEVN